MRVFALMRTALWSGAFATLAALGLMMTAQPGSAQITLDMDAIFGCEDQDQMEMEPCNQARELFLNNCTACHSFVQVVLRQYDRGGWTSLLNRHQERIDHLSAEEVGLIHDYLAAKFNPEREPPELPPEILEALLDY